MTKFKRLFLNCLLCLSFFCQYSLAHASEWFKYDAQKQVSIQVDLFLSSTCPHCHKADEFFRNIEKKEPWLVVHRYVINQDMQGLQTFYQHLQKQNSNNFSVPAIFFCDSRWSGFADENTTGKVLLQALSYCHQKVTEQGNLSQETINALQKWGNASQIQISANIEKSAFTLILLTALSDAFNPCSFFCLAAFLAFLWLYPVQKWTQFKIGLTFILFQAVIHFLQQANSANYYQVIPKLHFAAILIGIWLLITIIRSYTKLKRAQGQKCGFWVFVLVILTSIVVQIYQQTCKLNLGLFFDQWLAQQTISSVRYLFYQVIYQLIYILPLLLVLMVHFIFNGSNWVARHQQALKIASSLILASVGIILLASPAWLVYSWVSIIVLIGSIIVGWLVERRYE